MKAPRVKKPPRKFSDCFAKYRTYNPKVEGYGSVKDWGRAFDDVMGVKEAEAVLDSDNPLAIMGLKVLPDTLDELKKVYRKLVLIHHPDRGGDPAMATKVIAAYAVLEERIQRKART